MCLIIYNSDGSKVPEHHIRIAHENNPHGFGIMWAQDGRVQTYRDILDADEIIDLLGKFDGVPYVIHFRYRTRGPINENNCHPHRVLSHKADGHDLFMMHNGTFMFLKSDEEESDSVKFAKHLRGSLRVYGADSLFDKNQLTRMANRVGQINKMVFLRGDGKIALVNKAAGWENGALWYSNTYSLKPGYREIQARAVSKAEKEEKNPLIKKLNDTLLLDKGYAYRKNNNNDSHSPRGKNILDVELSPKDEALLLVPRNQGKKVQKNNNKKKKNKDGKTVLTKKSVGGNRSLVLFNSKKD